MNDICEEIHSLYSELQAKNKKWNSFIACEEFLKLYFQSFGKHN